MTKTIAKIDITDWTEKLDELLRKEEIQFESEQDLIDYLFLMYGFNAPEAGEIAIAAKEKGLIENDKIWPPHKPVLRKGGGSLMRNIGRKIKWEKRIGDKTFFVRQVIGTDHQADETQSENVNGKELENSQEPNVTQGGDATYYLTDSNKGRQIARDYILITVPYHIRERMIELAGHEDLKAIARQLKKEIDSIVKELS